MQCGWQKIRRLLIKFDYLAFYGVTMPSFDCHRRSGREATTSSHRSCDSNRSEKTPQAISSSSLFYLSHRILLAAAAS